jgi:hypothetical protein
MVTTDLDHLIEELEPVLTDGTVQSYRPIRFTGRTIKPLAVYW